MTPEQKVAHFDTLTHIKQVARYLQVCLVELSVRSTIHDNSKLESPEMEVFAKVTPILKTLEYGTPEYTEMLEQIRPCINHHYAANRHHPEHFENGVSDMNLLDVLEMICDWCAAVKRTENGNIYKSLEINKERFKLDDQLYTILKNTVDWFQQLNKVSHEKML